MKTEKGREWNKMTESNGNRLLQPMVNSRLNDVRCINYDKDHMSELQIKNRSERDLCSCEVT